MRASEQRIALCTSSHGEQALADRRTADGSFEQVDHGKDGPIVKEHFGGLKVAFFQDAKIQPPSKITNEIEMTKPKNFKTRFSEQLLQFLAPVTAKMTKVFVDGRVDFRASRNEKAEVAVPLAQHR